MTRREGRTVAIVDILLGFAVAAAACAIYLSGFGGAFALNSDMVMPYVVYRDAVAGPNALSGWLLPESPYWFPDLILAWAIRAVSSLNVTVNVFAFVQVASYLLVARWVLGLVEPARQRVAWLVFLLLWFVAVLIGMHATDSWFDRFGHYLFVPSTHAAALVITLASLGLVLRLGMAPRARGPLFLLGALALATVLSDRLYAISCLLPLLGVAALPLLPRVARVRVGALVLAILLGTEAWRGLTGRAGTASHYGPEKTPADSLAQMARDFATALASDPWASALVLFGVAALALALVRAVRARRTMAAGGFDAVATAAVFLALAIVLPLAASVALGRHTAMDSFRYAQTFGFVALPLAWTCAHVLPQARAGAAAWVLAAANALVLAGALAFADTSEGALRREWRAQAECMDAAHAEHGLHNGLSRYWHANSLTAQLRSGAPIFSVRADFDSVPINKNIDWIGARARSGAELPIIDFIDEFQFDPNVLDATFGAPRVRVQCPLSAVRVYARDAGVLGTLYRKNDWLPQDTLARYGRMAVPASVWAAGPARIEGDGLRVTGTFARDVEVAVGALQIERPIAKAWIDYSLPHGEADWRVLVLDAGGWPIDTLAEGRLAPAAEETHVVFELPRRRSDVRAVAFSLQARSEVDLFVRAIGVSAD